MKLKRELTITGDDNAAIKALISEAAEAFASAEKVIYPLIAAAHSAGHREGIEMAAQIADERAKRAHQDAQGTPASEWRMTVQLIENHYLDFAAALRAVAKKEGDDAGQVL